jgi:hypothetical protein
MDFHGDKELKRELEFGIERHCTCLDFAYMVRDEMTGIDFNFAPVLGSQLDKWIESDQEKVTISKEEYIDLMEQSNYLGRLV